MKYFYLFGILLIIASLSGVVSKPGFETVVDEIVLALLVVGLVTELRRK